MAFTPVRVLVVDDFAPFRRFVALLVQELTELQVVGEAADGLDAVRQAAALGPDLILLDIGLPRLNGIEAARRIRQLAPNCKILFLTQETSVGVMQAALDAGAQGYVLKTDAVSELLPAVAAVLRGEQFLGARFASRASADITNAILPLSGEHRAGIRHHEVGFYSDDASFLEGFTGFIVAALDAGNAVIVVVTEAHRAGLLPTLQARGLDIRAALEQGRLITLDAAQTFAAVTVDGVFAPARFVELAGNLITTAAKSAKREHPRVAICGECEPPLWKLGTGDAAIQFERLWNQIAAMHAVDILCGYPLSPFQSEQSSDLYASICAEHSGVHSW